LNPKSKTRSVVETGIVAALGAVATILGYYVPFLNLFLIFTAIPFAVITLRNGISYGIAGAFVASILVAITTNPLSALIVLFSSGINGIFLGIVVKRGLKAGPAILVTTAATLFSLYLSYYVILPLTGVDLATQIDQMVVEMNETMKLMQTSLNSTPEAAAESAKLMEAYTQNLKLLIPAGIILSALASASANYMLLRAILRRMRVALPEMKPFQEFRLPGSVFFGMLIMIILSYVSGKLGIIKSEALLVNIYAVFSIGFTLQGVAVLIYFFRRIPGRRVLKILLVVLIMMTGNSLYLTMLGMLDILFNFRKRLEDRLTMR
jgi:uncharacterized protein YybS (DUF2232 family)